MKANYFLGILAAFTLGTSIGSMQTVFAQTQTADEHDRQTGNNEIKINVLSAVLAVPEISYERFVADNMGLGVSIGVSLESPEQMSTRQYIAPYYRLYFGRRKAKGIFIEGNSGVVRQHERKVEVQNSGLELITERKTVNFGMGAAVGYKLTVRNGFSSEIYAGGGNLFGDSVEDLYPRIGLSICKRF